MSINLPLESMTTAEKLSALEAIWASLCSKPSEIELPKWHADILAERRRRLQSGETTVSDWDEAKKRIRDFER